MTSSKSAATPDQTTETSTTAWSQPEKEPDKRRVPPGVTQVLGNEGAPLPETVRSFMAPRFGHSFDDVRVHSGAAAARSAANVGALAYTVGNNVVFGSGHYQPGTAAGQRLLAHELTHVVQQRGAGSSATVQRKAVVSDPGDRSEREADRVADQVMQASGVADTDQQPFAPVPTPQVRIVEAVQSNDISRLVDPTTTAGSSGTSEAGDAVPSPVESAPGTAEAGPDKAQQAPAADPPALPEGSLTVSAASLIRGQTLTATFTFDTSKGAAANVTSWTYITNSDTVTRDVKEADFQSEWKGVMTLSGALSLDYEATASAGGTPTTKSLSQDVTVTDRSGAKWVSTLTEKEPIAFTGRSSPPKKFNDLGRHLAWAKSADPTSDPLTAGPNTGFTYVSDLTAGTYKSTPKIHPDVDDETSDFWTFHQDASRLYFVPTTGAKSVIPLTEYSALTASSSGPTFTVPNWEAFYKLHNVYTLSATATVDDKEVTKKVKKAWWGFETNAKDGVIKITDDAALRAALGIGPNDAYSVQPKTNGSWEGYELYPSAKISAGTHGHEYKWTTHSHRANFKKILKALDPQRRIESRVSTPNDKNDFKALLETWRGHLLTDDGHKLVDEAASRTNETYEVTDTDLAGINQDKTTGAVLGTVWNITGKKQMSN